LVSADTPFVAPSTPPPHPPSSESPTTADAPTTGEPTRPGGDTLPFRRAAAPPEPPARVAGESLPLREPPAPSGSVPPPPSALATGGTQPSISGTLASEQRSATLGSPLTDQAPRRGDEAVPFSTRTPARATPQRNVPAALPFA